MGATIANTRSLIERAGVDALAIDPLTEDDLKLLSWSGSRLHIESMADALTYVPSGAVEYLAVRAPDGSPIAKGGLDHRDKRGPGKLWQLATHPKLQSMGIGTRLIAALEARVRARGVGTAWLGVELENRRARALYERLGYEAFAEETDGWETMDTTGRRSWKEARLTLMRRVL